MWCKPDIGVHRGTAVGRLEKFGVRYGVTRSFGRATQFKCAHTTSTTDARRKTRSGFFTAKDAWDAKEELREKIVKKKAMRCGVTVRSVSRCH